MPAHTKEQLVAMNADRKQFKWCRSCKKYCNKQGLANHARSCGQKHVITSDFNVPDAVLTFEPWLLAANVDKLLAALVEPKPDGPTTSVVDDEFEEATPVFS